MADTVMVRLPGELAERIKALGHKREPFVREAVEAALGDGREAVAASRPSPRSSPSAPPRASAKAPQVDHAIEAKAILSGAEDGGTGPSFRTRDLSGHDFPGGHDAYKAWRSRRDRWRSR